MVKRKVLVLRAPGINNDMETANAFRMTGARDVNLVHVNLLLCGNVKLNDYDVLAIPGGFSYGDDVSAGKILANIFRFQLHDQLKEFISSGRKVIGICNGFQVLVKSGFLPGWNETGTHQQVTLTWNDSARFECRWIYLNLQRDCVAFTRNVPRIIQLPVAHAEGKFVVRNASVLERLERNHQILFRYCDQNGGHAPYPINPNGSIGDVAGICNKDGNVIGMMPHPERFVWKYNHPRWTLMDKPHSDRDNEHGAGLEFLKALL